MGCSDLLAGPHEQGIGIIGTMGIGPDGPYCTSDAVPVARDAGDIAK